MNKQLTLTTIIEHGRIFTWTVEKPLSPIRLPETGEVLVDNDPDPDHTPDAQPLPDGVSGRGWQALSHTDPTTMRPQVEAQHKRQ